MTPPQSSQPNSTDPSSAIDTQNRIDRIFADQRAADRTSLMPFITAGYPTLETTLELLPRLEEAGASICEIGLPFSDPIADGPVIAASMHEALLNDFRLEHLFEALPEVRSRVKLGLVAMVSYSIVHRFGLNAFVERCADAGFDGFIFPDLPVEEAGEARQVIESSGLTASLLIAPTTDAGRSTEIARVSTGFVYLMARVGITGERDEKPEVETRVAALREVTDTPIACGFGIGSADAVKAVTQHADAAIVGSAIVRRMQEMAHAPRDEIVDMVGGFVAELAHGLSRR